MRNIAAMLQSFRDDLPADNRTAAAIDRGASLEISELAEAEGLHRLASVLFEAEQEALRDGPDAVRGSGRSRRCLYPGGPSRDLPADSRTAAAIDRGASWEEISEIAEEEGLHRIASVLFEAEQEALRTSTA